MKEARQSLDAFLDKYSAQIACDGRALLDRLQDRIPGASILVYDNYNALAIGFASSDRASTVVLSIALYPQWINLFFMRGVELGDPHGLLRGEGSRVRHIPRVTADSLDDPRIEALITDALAIADPPIDPSAQGSMIIKSISKRQRPRQKN